MKKLLFALSLFLSSSIIFPLRYNLIYFEQQGLIEVKTFANNQLFFVVYPGKLSHLIFAHSPNNPVRKIKLAHSRQQCLITEPDNKGTFFAFNTKRKSCTQYKNSKINPYKAINKKPVTHRYITQNRNILSVTYSNYNCKDKSYNYIQSINVLTSKKSKTYEFNKKVNLISFVPSNEGNAVAIKTKKGSNDAQILICNYETIYEINTNPDSKIIHLGPEGTYILIQTQNSKYSLYNFSEDKNKYINTPINNLNINSNNQDLDQERTLQGFYNTYFQDHIDIFHIPNKGIFVVEKVREKYNLYLFNTKLKNISLLNPTCIAKNSPIGISNQFKNPNVQTIKDQVVILGSKYNDLNKHVLKTVPALEYYEKYLKPHLYNFKIHKGYKPRLLLQDRHTGLIAVLFWKPETLKWAVCYIKTKNSTLDCGNDKLYCINSISDDLKTVTGSTDGADKGITGCFWKSSNRIIIEGIQSNTEFSDVELAVEGKITLSHATGQEGDIITGYLELLDGQTISFINTIEDNKRVTLLLPQKCSTKALGIQNKIVYGTISAENGEHACTWKLAYDLEEGLKSEDLTIIPFTLQSKHAAFIPKSMTNDGTILANYFPRDDLARAYVIKKNKILQLSVPKEEESNQVYGQCIVDDHVGGFISGKACIWKLENDQWIPTLLPPYKNPNSKEKPTQSHLTNVDKYTPNTHGVRWISKKKNLACGHSHRKPQIWIKSSKNVWVPVNLSVLYQLVKPELPEKYIVQCVRKISDDKKHILLEGYDGCYQFKSLTVELENPVQIYFKID